MASLSLESPPALFVTGATPGTSSVCRDIAAPPPRIPEYFSLNDEEVRPSVDSQTSSSSSSPPRLNPVRVSTISSTSVSGLVSPRQGKRNSIARFLCFKRGRDSTQQRRRPNGFVPNLMCSAECHDAEKGGGTKGKPKARACYGWRLVFLGSWLNILLIFIPAVWVLQMTTNDSHTLVFIFCILAMIPLVKLHDLATNDLAVRLGGSKTGLLNASLANTVEIVIAIIALRKCELRVVQSTLIGTMLSKLLLVLGMCFFAGGLRFSEQGFDATATQIHSSLLSISVGAVLLPAAFHFALTYRDEDAMAAGTTLQKQKTDILQMSHGVSIVLLFIYGSYLLFQFWSHTHLFDDSAIPASQKLPKSISARTFASSKKGAATTPRMSTPSPPLANRPQFREMNSSFLSQDDSALSPSNLHSGSPYLRTSRCCSEDFLQSTLRSKRPANLVSSMMSPYSTSSQVNISPPDLQGHGSTVRLIGPSGRNVSIPNSINNWNGTSPSKAFLRTSASPEMTAYVSDSEGSNDGTPRNQPWGGAFNTEQTIQAASGRCREPRMSWYLTLSLLVFVTVLVAVNAEWMVESMDHLSPMISKEWIGLILLPTVSAIAECFTAMNISVKDQLSLSISVAVGSTIQTALFVIPFMVILGWILNKPLALLFDPFESLVLYISVHTMSYVVADGRSNWLEGVILVCLYVVIAVTFWFYPGSSFSSTLAVCSTSA